MTTTATITSAAAEGRKAPHPPRPGEASAAPRATYVELHGVRWETYAALAEDVAEQHVGITYDAGRMVLMAPRAIHDRRKRLVGRMIETASQVMKIPIASLGSTTWKREDLAKGLEADECYYVQNEARVRTELEDFDLPQTPPPDLAVEVDNTHHPLDRPSIYAGLGVNELWHHDGKRLRFLKRVDDGRYQPIDASEAFPFLTPEVIERHLAMFTSVGEFAMIGAFQDWLTSLPQAPE